MTATAGGARVTPPLPGCHLRPVTLSSRTGCCVSIQRILSRWCYLPFCTTDLNTASTVETQQIERQPGTIGPGPRSLRARSTGEPTHRRGGVRGRLSGRDHRREDDGEPGLGRTLCRLYRARAAHASGHPAFAAGARARRSRRGHHDAARNRRRCPRRLQATRAIARGMGCPRAEARRDSASARSSTSARSLPGSCEPRISRGSASVRSSPALTTGVPPLIERLLDNLLAIAVRRHRAGGWIAITAGSSSSQALSTIENPGRRIPGEELARLFEPFHQLLAARLLGRGLRAGLAVAKAVADAHGAVITPRARRSGGLRVAVAFSPATDGAGDTVLTEQR